MKTDINEIIANWSIPSVDLPKTGVTVRIPAQTFCQITALQEIYGRGRVEIILDLLDFALSRLSESLPRQQKTKAQLWAENDDEHLDKDDFDHFYPGTDSTVFDVGMGVRFDNTWRKKIKEMAEEHIASGGASSSPVELVASKGVAVNG